MGLSVGDDLIELIEGYPFPVALKNAAEMRWSGILRAVKDAEQVGVIVMRDGHVAWAVSNIQTENFGSFLERIGMIPKEKLDEVVRKYRSLGKTKKLGALLEEAGLISHATLRECLKAHVRAAISSLLDDPLIILEARNGEMAIDASLIFMLNEVYSVPDETSADAEPPPVEVAAGGGGGEETCAASETEILQELSLLPGYLYSFVANMAGKVLALHGSDGATVNADRVVPAVLAWISTSSLSSVEMETGAVMFAFMQCETGSLFVHLVGADNRHFVAVACNENAKLGVVRHKISEMLPTVRRFTEVT
jgi:hypothetical protein